MPDDPRPPAVCSSCGREVPPPGGRCPHCRALRPDVARDRALYHGFLLLTLAMAVVRWVTALPPGEMPRGSERWTLFLHPLVVLPLSLAMVFAWRVVRKTGRFWWR